MPPRASLTNAFSTADPKDEVVCPLRNHDGSQCRKRCFGEKRYRSMQEHIRRAHPEYYIPKLPATEESFRLMINSTPSERPPPNQNPPGAGPSGQDPFAPSFDDPPLTAQGQPYGHSDYYKQEDHPSAYHHHQQQSQHHDARRGSLLPAASAAAALAQLHNSRPDNEWGLEQEPFPGHEDEYLHNYFASPGSGEMFAEHAVPPESSPQMTREMLGSALHRTPSASNRASSLQPFPRSRPRKSSVTEHARRPKHERDRSKDHKKRLSHDRKALSAEPNAANVSSKRWEDLLDAAASATEEDSRDLTPIPQSPRSPMPGTAAFHNSNQFHSYAASPLQNSILPQSPEPQGPGAHFETSHMQPYPSVEQSSQYDPHNQQHSQHPYHQHQASGDSTASYAYQRHIQHPSGSNFHISHEGLSSSPQDHMSAHRHHNSTSSMPRSSHQNLPPHFSSPQQQQQHHSHHSTSYPGPTTPTTATAAAPHHTPQSVHAAAPPPPPPQPPSSPPVVQHYCAACHRITPLTSSFACTECICGICRDCVDVLIGMGPERGASCPRCHTVGGKFKPFLLELR